jgi:hypothetical protein
MDPLTAIANLLTALANLAATVAEGQTPEQRKQIWDWVIADMARWRKLFNLPE